MPTYPDFTHSVLSGRENFTLGQVFEPLRQKATVVVVYDDPAAGEDLPETSAELVNDLSDNYFQIIVGLPFKIPNATNDDKVNCWKDYPVHTWGDSACSLADSAQAGLPIERYSVSRESRNVWRIEIDAVMFIKQRINLTINSTVRKRSVQVWKAPYDTGYPTFTYTAGTTNAFDDLIDCNAVLADQIALVDGRNVDLNGNPLTRQLPQTALTVSFVLRSPYYADDPDDDLTVDESWKWWAQGVMPKIESRNIDSIFGLNTGKVLLESVTVTSLGILEYQRCDVVFLVDAWQHLTQQPLTFFGSVTGIVPRCPAETDGTRPNPVQSVFGTDNVMWINPHIFGFNTTNDIYNRLPCNGGLILDEWDWEDATP